MRDDRFLVAAMPTTLEANVLLSSVKVPKKAKTVQTNMVEYVIWIIDFKSKVRSVLRGCLETIVASKPHFFGD